MTPTHEHQINQAIVLMIETQGWVSRSGITKHLAQFAAVGLIPGSVPYGTASGRVSELKNDGVLLAIKSKETCTPGSLIDPQHPLHTGYRKDRTYGSVKLVAGPNYKAFRKRIAGC